MSDQTDKNSLAGNNGHCVLCQSKSYTLRHSFISPPDHDQAFTIVTCNTCNHLYTWPPPSEKTLESIYSPDEYAEFYTNMESIDAHQQVNDERWAIIKPFINEGLCLDFGCGIGVFASRASKHGFKSIGYEPDIRAQQFGQAQFDLQILSAPEQLEQYHNQIDLIAAWDVLEHIKNPADCVDQWTTLLKPGGKLAFCVPNANCMEGKLFGAHSFGWVVPNHFHHYKSKELCDYLIKKGYSINLSRYIHHPFVTLESINKTAGKDWTCLGAYDGKRTLLSKILRATIGRSESRREKWALKFSQWVIQFARLGKYPERQSHLFIIASKGE